MGVIKDLNLPAKRSSLETTGNVTVGGDLTVNGTTTTINSTTFDSTNATITTADGGNTITTDIIQNDVTNNPIALRVTNTGTGDSVQVNTIDFVIKDSGKIGIGTASPNHDLVINNATGAVSLGLYTDKTATDARNWAFRPNSIVNGDFDLRQSDARLGDPLVAGTTKFYIDNNGYIGIGTTTPSSKLNVNSGTGGAPLSASANTSAVFQSGSGVGNGGAIGFNYIVPASVLNYPVGLGYSITDNTSQTKGALVFGTRDVTTDTAPTERMRIDSAGNIGIGTSTPSSLLDVNGSTNINGSMTANSINMNSGGIMTLSTTLDNTFRIGNVDSHSTSTGSALGLGSHSNGQSYLDVKTLPGGSFVFRIGAGTESSTTRTWMVAKASNGHVGMGTTTPTANLHIKDNATVYILLEGIRKYRLQSDSSQTFGIYDETSSAWRLVTTPTGEIGIGTLTPNANAALDVTSTTKAFMPPRMTTTQRDAIASPTAGMVIYNTTTNVLDFHNGTSWGPV